MPREEPFAQPPRHKRVATGTTLVDPSLALDRGWAELSGVTAEGLGFDLTDCAELELVNSNFTDVEFGEASDTEFSVADCRFEKCDLSGIRFSSIRRAAFIDCKFLGTNFSTGALADVSFEQCTFRFVNMRLAKLARVAFQACSIDDLDLFDAAVEDLDFSRSRIAKLGVDRITAERVDLRHAAEVGFSQIIRLDGFLVAESQLPQLMHGLAQATGLSVE